MQVDDEMVEVPVAECNSLFSVSLPQNSYYFQNVRNIDNMFAFIKRGKNFQMYQHGGTGGPKLIGQTDKYHVRLAVLPGKGEFIVVGGSEDAECTRLSDKVYMYDQMGKVSEKKQICQPRAKVGLAIGELCSEANAQFRKTFVYAFGGVNKDGVSLKVCEKYNMRADIWQSMPILNIARQNATGQTIGDSLYVFGGINGGTSIERINLKLNMQRNGDKFELLEIRLPTSASDIGILPCLSPQEILLVGGYGTDGRSVAQIMKFQARTMGTGQSNSSQDQVECSIEELNAEGFRADFFNMNSVVTMDNSENNDQCMIFGA